MEEQAEVAKEKRTVRFNFAVNEVEKLKSQGKELGFLEPADLEEGELAQFETRATGWSYMLDMDDLSSALGRYSSSKAAKLLMPDGKWYNFDSTQCAENLEAILLKAQTKVPPFTHVDMLGVGGGKFYIASSEEEAEKLGRPLWHTQKQFLQMYALATLYGHKTWLIEQHTPHEGGGNLMVFFMDLDFGQPEIIKPSTIEVLIFIIVRALKKFFPGCADDLLQCICATTVCKIDRCQSCLCSSCQEEPSKLCEECKGVGNTGRLKASSVMCSACGGKYPVKKKTGLHVHFPNLVLTTAHALDVRQTMIAECTRLWGVRMPPFNPWEDVFDRSVYEKSGLRMIGANKGEVCKACKGSKSKERCEVCHNRRRIDQGRPYFPLACFGSNGYRDKALEAQYEGNFCDLIECVSIRATGKVVTPGYVLYEGAPTDATRIVPKKKRARSVDGQPGPATTKSKSNSLAGDAPEVVAIQNFFSAKNVADQFCPEKYGQLVVTQVKVRNLPLQYKVDVTGDNCRYCMNKGDYHGGNRVYFEFRAATKQAAHCVVQRCYCEKDEVRKYGTCKDYESRPLLLPERIADILFPKSGGGSCKTSEVGSVISRLDARTMSATSRSQSQMLLNAGNLLVRELFGPQQTWTTSPRFMAMYGNSMLQVPLLRKDKEHADRQAFRTIRLDALGPQDDKVKISLGFMEEEHTEAEFKRIKATPTIKELQHRLSNTIKHILNVALHADETQVLEVLQSATSFKALRDIVTM